MEAKPTIPATAVKAESPLLAAAFVLERIQLQARSWISMSLRTASGHREGALHLSQDDPSKIYPVPSVHLSTLVLLLSCHVDPASVFWGQRKSNADTSHPEVSSMNSVFSKWITSCTESQNGIIRHTFHSLTYTVAGSFNVFLKMLAKPSLWSVEFMVCLSSSFLSPPISISVSVYPACLTVNPLCVLVCIVHISHNPNSQCYEPGVLWFFFFFLLMIRLNFGFCCGCIHVIINVSGISFIKFRHALVLWLLCTVSSHRARSFRPYLKGKNVHLTSEMTVFLVCFAEIPVVSPTAVVSSTEEPAGQCTLSAPSPISTTALREELKHVF